MGLREISYHDIHVGGRPVTVRISLDLSALAKTMARKVVTSPTREATMAFGAVRAQLMTDDGEQVRSRPAKPVYRGAVKERTAVARAAKDVGNALESVNALDHFLKTGEKPSDKRPTVKVVWPANALKAGNGK